MAGVLSFLVSELLSNIVELCDFNGSYCVAVKIIPSHGVTFVNMPS